MKARHCGSDPCETYGLRGFKPVDAPACECSHCADPPLTGILTALNEHAIVEATWQGKSLIRRRRCPK